MSTQERDYGDSAGYGTGGSTLDYADITGDPTYGEGRRPNPLDEVMNTGGGSWTEPYVDIDEERVAQGLGWFSIGLGLTELVAARSLGRWLGMEDRADLIRLFGAQRRPAGWMWARVAGDMMDLAALGTAVSRDNPKLRNVEIAMAAVAGITVLDMICAEQLSER